MSTTETPPPAGPSPSDQGPRVTRDEARDLSRLRRTRRESPEGRYVAGVAGGLARHLDVDPVLLRILFVVLTFFGGGGLLVYLACWMLVPEEGRPEAPVRLDDRSRALALYVVGGLGALALLGNTLGHWGFPWPLAVLSLVLLGVVSQWDRLGVPRTRRQPAGDVSAVVTGDDRAAGTALADAGAAVPPLSASPLREPDPRKTGPILFWFTLALIALAEGCLGVVDAAGVDVVPPAYPALAVGVIGTMLVLAAFWGRGGGLILLGLVASVALTGATAAHKAGLDTHGANVTLTPTSAAAVLGHYSMRTGSLTLDLTEVADPASLAGRTIDLRGRVGQIRVRVPAGVSAQASGRVRGPGHVRAFGSEDAGFGAEASSGTAAGTHLTIAATLNVGDIDIETES